MKWLRRIRGAIGTGLIWAVGWAVAGILLIGVPSKILTFLPWHYFFDVFDAPLPAMAVPGFIGGVFFSVVLGIAGRRHKFRDLSLSKFAAWGALGGLMVIALPFAMVAAGLASTDGSSGVPPLGVATVGLVLILFSALSASGSLMLARMGEDRSALSPDEDLDELGSGEGAAQEVRRRDEAESRLH